MKGLGRRPKELEVSIGKGHKIKENIKVLLVDQWEIVRQELRRWLEPQEGIEVVGDCAKAEEAFSLVGILSPNIVLVGAYLPSMDGIEATRGLKRNGLDYDGDVIIFAESGDYRAEALEAGAAGYILKEIGRVELAQAIRQVYLNKYLPEKPLELC